MLKILKEKPSKLGLNTECVSLQKQDEFAYLRNDQNRDCN